MPFQKGHKINIGRKHSNISKYNMSICKIGKKLSEKHKEKLRKSHIGKKISLETRKKISLNSPKIWLGKKLSSEHRAKLSKAKLKLYKNKKNHPRWKLGKRKTTAGYIEIMDTSHSHCNNNGYVKEHRLIIENYLNRNLKIKEVIHHINGIKDDNRLINLILFSCHSAHIRFHNNPKKVKDHEILFDGRRLKS